MGRKEGNIHKNRMKNPLFPPLFFIFFTFVLLHSCATVKNNSQKHLIENVPFHPQTTYQCGPASLAGVLNYWGVKVTPDEIAGEIYSESARGTLSIDMVLYAQGRGLKATQYEGDIEDLRKNIDSGHPIIVLVDYGFSFYQMNHFMVVIGYDEHGVIVNSGKDKYKFISEKDFIKAWKKTKFWTLLIRSRQQE